MQQDMVDEAARMLTAAYRARQLIGALPADLEPSDLASAYHIQHAFVGTLDDGVAGYKVGLTNPAAQAARGMTHPVRGHLLSNRIFRGKASLWAGWRRQMLEAEYVFEFDRDLPRRERPYDRADVIAAVARLYPALEVCGSRLGQEAVSMESALADNSSHSALVLGAPVVDWTEADLVDMDVTISAPGHDPVSGSGRNVLGDPLLSLEWIVNEMTGWGGIKAGQLVATGACAILPVKSLPLSATANFGRLGMVRVDLSNDANAA